MRRTPFFAVLLGLVACGGGPAEKPVAPQHVDTNSSSPAAPDSLTQWQAMLRNSYKERDAPSAALALTVIAERWPESVGTLPRSSVSYGLRSAEGDAGRYRLYKAFLASEPGREFATGGSMWREFALLQLGRGEQQAALASLASITDPYVIVSVEADKRFDGIRASVTPPLDVERGANQSIDAAREACRKNPNKLRPVWKLIDDLNSAARFADALQVADATATKAAGPKGSSEYSDYQEEYVWLLNYRAETLQYLGRWTEAAQQLEAASRLPEHGNSNVSQVINLAALYNDLGQPEAARQTLLRVPPEFSPFGAMQKTVEELRSAVQLGDQEATTRALAFITEHQTDAPYTYVRALLVVGKPKDAAQVLIKQLRDTKERSRALLRVQHYAYGALTENVQEFHERWQAMQSLPEVRDAIAAVGYVGTYPVTSR